MNEHAIIVSKSSQDALQKGTLIRRVRVEPSTLKYYGHEFHIEDAWVEREVRLGDTTDLSQILLGGLHPNNPLRRFVVKLLDMLFPRTFVTDPNRTGRVLAYRLNVDAYVDDLHSPILVVEGTGRGHPLESRVQYEWLGVKLPTVLHMHLQDGFYSESLGVLSFFLNSSDTNAA